MTMSTLLPPGLARVERKLVPDPPLSDEDFEELCRAFDLVQLERTKEGVILMNPPAGALTGDANAELIWQLRSWWNTHERGRVFDSNTGLYLSDGSMLSPTLPTSFRKHWKV